MAKKQRLAKQDEFASEASLGPWTNIRINGAEGLYRAPRRCHGPLEHEVNTRGIGGMRELVLLDGTGRYVCNT